MTARIFKPAKNAMQSGRAKTKEWQLDYEPEQPRAIEPLMGWTSSGDMKQQLTLRFDTKEDAVAYCERKGIAYQVIEPKEPAQPAGRLCRQFCVPARRTLDPLRSRDVVDVAAEASLRRECGRPVEIASRNVSDQDISKVRVALDRGPMTP